MNSKLFCTKAAIFILLIVLVFSFTQCAKSEDPVVDLSSALEEVYNIAHTNSINRYDIDWAALRQQMIDAESDLGFVAGLRTLLRNLADNHSFYQTATGQYIGESNADCSGDGFDLSALPKDIGYVRVEAFSGSQPEGEVLAASIQSQIREQDSPNIKSWVVDLSYNLGGNMYPMIAGLGPFYTQDTLGYFIDPDGEEISWGYKGNGSRVNRDYSIITQVADPYTIIDPAKKLVVLVDNPTASSGEAAAISFAGRSNTLLLGRPSCGLSTANSAFDISNGGSS